MAVSRLFAALCACLALAACQSDDEDIGPAPVAQLAGPWLMINRQLDCTDAFTAFGQGGIYRLPRKGAHKLYASVRKIQIGPETVIMQVSDLQPAPDTDLSLVFMLKDEKIRLTDLKGAKGESFRDPPKDLEPAEQARMTALYRIIEQRFALDRCPAS